MSLKVILFNFTSPDVIEVRQYVFAHLNIFQPKIALPKLTKEMHISSSTSNRKCEPDDNY